MSKALPAGWEPIESTSAQLAELKRELSQQHALSGVALESVARCEANDGVLFRRVDDPERFAIVHLTWSGHPDRDPSRPRVPFEGTFAEFVAFARTHA